MPLKKRIVQYVQQGEQMFVVQYGEKQGYFQGSFVQNDEDKLSDNLVELYKNIYTIM